ncbi:MAG: hypothetical protein K8T89_24480 [Planctomycetes bacterium]|nr:hypothetical protein [Planctomycetota bacterium]
MQRIYASLFVVLSVSFLAAEDPKGGVKITDDVNKSEIVFPDKPKETVLKGGKQAVLSRENGKVALMLQFNEINGLDITKADLVKVVFDNGRTALTKAFPNAKLISEKDLKLNDKFPARDVDVDAPNLGLYRVRMVMTNKGLYQVTVLGPADYQKGDESKKFIESFKIKE